MRRALLPLSFVLVVALFAACSSSGIRSTLVTPTASEADGPRVLCVIAHPDDETTFAGALYKIATFLGGRCDIALITNGEGGFKYSTLAEPIYGLELTEEDVGRRELPDIRLEEMLAGCSILGVHELITLGEKDHRYTTDALEVLGPRARAWDLARVSESLALVLERGDYDFVFTMAPTSSTHAHHKSATILALRAVAELPEQDRPAVLCARTGDHDAAPAFEALDGFPITTPDRARPFWFDRTQKFGFKERLDYSIVVNWVIAEHKSQGTMQLAVNGAEREWFQLFRGGPPDGEERCRRLFDALTEPQFPQKTYGPSAGTNTVR